jgi:hypothetical protein
VSQWLAAQHQFGVGVHGGVDIIHLMVRTVLDDSPDWADMQGDASNAFNAFLRRPLFEELSANPALRSLLRVDTIVWRSIYLVHLRLIKCSRPGHVHPENPWSPSKLRSRGHVLRNSCLPGIQTVGSNCPERIRCLRLF